jgi:hypothetical protein
MHKRRIENRMKNEEGEQHGFSKDTAPPREVSQRLGRIPWPSITTVCTDHCCKSNSIQSEKRKKYTNISSSFFHHHFLSLISLEDGCAYDVTSAEWLVEECEAKYPISLFCHSTLSRIASRFCALHKFESQRSTS